jgi:hypothetical protein
MNNQPVPPFITKYFWGDDLAQLSLESNQKYIVETLLEKGDEKALHWLFSSIDKQILANYLQTLKLSKKSEHYWSIYFA